MVIIQYCCTRRYELSLHHKDNQIRNDHETFKIKIMSIAFMAVATSSMAQSLNKMNWLNEPQQWEIKDGKTLVMDVPAKTDFWRISHYGFTVDDGPFYYATYGGEFEAKVKITGNYVTTFDQMGLMLRIDHENWIKAGVEYVDGKQNVSAVVTHRTSDWSVVQLPDAPRSIWIKAVRRLDAVEIFSHVMIKNIL